MIFFRPFYVFYQRNHVIFAYLVSLCYLLIANIVPIAAQKIGVKTGNPQTVLDVNGSVAFREGSPLAVVNGANNNVAVDSMSFYRMTAPTTAFSITGFTNGLDGRLLTVVNATSYTCTVLHESVSSTSANQIRTGTGSNIELLAGGIVNLMYNNGLQKWLVTSVQGANIVFSTAPPTGSTTDGILTVSGTTIRQISFSDLDLAINNTFLRKTANESVSNSTTLQDDDHLFFTLNANETWLIDGILFVNGQAPGIKIAFDVGTGSIQSDITFNKSVGLSNSFHAIYSTSGSALEYDLDIDNTNSIHIKGFIVGPASGSTTFKIRWSQKSANGSPTIMKQNSYLHLRRVE